MKGKEITQELLDFIQKSPTAFHAVDTIAKELDGKGFTPLIEGERWTLEKGRGYYVTRNDSSILAFYIGRELTNYSFSVVAAHSDSPTFKLKENAELEAANKHYMQLNTEGYGGMLCAPWFDRPLSIAGRVLVREGESFVTRLLTIDRDLVMIPNVAIHMNRQVNDGFAYNKQVDMLPLFGGPDTKKGDLKKLIAQELGVSEGDIFGSDLYLYNRVPGVIWGANGEYVSSGRLDDLQCAFSGLKALENGCHEKSVSVLAIFDNEEVGSGTKQGADSTMLSDVLRRINAALGYDDEEYNRAVASSFLLSADNAHAVHPNHPEKTDATNCVYMNEGVVIKSHAGQKYTSDGVSIAVFKHLAEKAGVPVQFFANRSDAAGGSTLGNIAMAQVSMNAVDIGLPQLAMHSAYETAGVKDTGYMIDVMSEFYRSHFEQSGRHVLTVSR